MSIHHTLFSLFSFFVIKYQCEVPTEDRRCFNCHHICTSWMHDPLWVCGCTAIFCERIHPYEDILVFRGSFRSAQLFDHVYRGSWLFLYAWVFWNGCAPSLILTKLRIYTLILEEEQSNAAAHGGERRFRQGRERCCANTMSRSTSFFTVEFI